VTRQGDRQVGPLTRLGARGDEARHAGHEQAPGKRDLPRVLGVLAGLAVAEPDGPLRGQVETAIPASGLGQRLGSTRFAMAARWIEGDGTEARGLEAAQPAPGGRARVLGARRAFQKLSRRSFTPLREQAAGEPERGGHPFGLVRPTQALKKGDDAFELELGRVSTRA
jgi:hypothetical protein